MGYFPNGTSGEMYESRYCETCVHYGPEDGPGCPIWGLHLLHNYDQIGESDLAKVLGSALSSLIPRTPDDVGNEQCRLYHPDKADRRTLPLFPSGGWK